MTLEEINEELRKRGWTNRKLAEELGVNESGLGQILKGNRPLTEQLSKHIEYVLDKRKQQTFIYTVDLPEGTVRSWVPGFETLSPEEQQKTLHAICHDVLGQLAAKGAERLTAKERAELQDLIAAGERTPSMPAYGKELEPFA